MPPITYSTSLEETQNDNVLATITEDFYIIGVKYNVKLEFKWVEEETRYRLSIHVKKEETNGLVLYWLNHYSNILTLEELHEKMKYVVNYSIVNHW